MGASPRQAWQAGPSTLLRRSSVPLLPHLDFGCSEGQAQSSCPSGEVSFRTPLCCQGSAQRGCRGLSQPLAQPCTFPGAEGAPARPPWPLDPPQRLEGWVFQGVPPACRCPPLSREGLSFFPAAIPGRAPAHRLISCSVSAGVSPSPGTRVPAVDISYPSSSVNTA